MRVGHPRRLLDLRLRGALELLLQGAFRDPSHRLLDLLKEDLEFPRGADEQGAGELGSTQVGVAEIGALEIESAQARVAEIGSLRRLIYEGEQLGILNTREAMRLADEAGLQLVEVNPKAAPPVCKIMDYGKFLFEQKKQRSAQKKKTKQIQVKEVKFRPGTDEGDYQVKLRNLIRFLEGGDKGKVTLRFRGREMAHQDLGLDLLNRVRDDVGEAGKVEAMPKLEGRQMVMMIAPR